MTEYAARAVSRRSSPLDIAQDLAEFARVATLREKPMWAHDSREIRSWPVARLIDHSAPSHTASVPTLVLPPQAGHASSIVDYGRGQSQMMTLRDGGLDNLYAIDWLPRPPKQRTTRSRSTWLYWRKRSSFSGGG